MAYIDSTFFKSYSTTEIADSEFAILADRASDMIDVVTMDKITRRGGISAFPDEIQTRIKKATAAQVDMLYAQGGEDAFTETDPDSATLGKFSFTKTRGAGSSSELRTVYGVPIAPMALPLLRPTGLLFRGITPHRFYGPPAENLIWLEDTYI